MLIEELGFSARTYNCLKRCRIDTVEELACMSEKDLLKIRSFGQGCLREVKEKIMITPAIPGPEESDPNLMELCFRNGEAHMKEKIISYLMDQKTRCKGICHTHIVDLIQAVEGM